MARETRIIVLAQNVILFIRMIPLSSDQIHRRAAPRLPKADGGANL